MSTSPSPSVKKLILLSVGALGVVFGDIGTSPLYAVNEIFFGLGQVDPKPVNIYGAIGLIFYSLTILISFKYIFLVLRADADGEGGVFALLSLIERIKIKKRAPFLILLSSLLIFSAGLLFGDGIITPAISVISAVEGLKVATDSFAPLIVPFSILILTVLFLSQSRGTAKIGSVFGPVIVVWLLALGVLGLSSVLKHPHVLNALNPLYVFILLSHLGLRQIFLVMGALMLVITGGEALYADLGHFGRRPIRLGWFGLAYPMLVLNYLGQGAYLLSGREVIHHNIFYSMVPNWSLYPMVVLSTFAAVIASQALISGAFSLATQAMALGLFPLLKVIHTHEEHEGQRYLSVVNWSLYLGTVFLVLIFRSSSHLASAYGLAVSGVMLTTTLGLFVIARSYWRWSTTKTFLVLLPLLFIDFIFLSANSLKIFEGGFIPLLIAAVLVVIMKTWRWGKAKVEQTIQRYPAVELKKLLEQKHRAERFLPRTVVIMTAKPILSLEDKVPALEQIFLERFGLLPLHIIFLTVVFHKVPYMKRERYRVLEFYSEGAKGSVSSALINFGFMEEPNVERNLLGLSYHHRIKISAPPTEWLVLFLDDRIVASSELLGPKRLFVKLFQFLDHNSIDVEDYFGLVKRLRLSAEILPIRINR